MIQRLSLKFVVLMITINIEKYTKIFCLKRTGPKTGISLKIGKLIDLKTGASFNSGLLFKRWLVKKLVIPKTKILMATPAII